MLFSEPHGLQNPNDLLFDEVPLSVQLHNLPLAFMHSTILRNLGEKLGTVIEVDEGDRGICSGKFSRIRILKKIDKPLEKGIWLRLKNSLEESCILLLYEKLPISVWLVDVLDISVGIALNL